MWYCALALLCGAVLLMPGCAGILPGVGPIGEQLIPAEEPIPGVPEEANYPDFWIRQAPFPDEVLMTDEQVAVFNESNPTRGSFLIDVAAMPDTSAGASIRDFITGNARYLLDARFLVTGDIPLERAERERIVALMDTAAVPDEIPLRFGLVLARTMGREWPTEIPLLRIENDNEFDYGATSSVDTATPVALLHASRDGRWVFVQTPRFPCWLPASAVAFGDRETVTQFLAGDPPLVVVGGRVSVFGLPGDGAAIADLETGSRVPLRTVGRDFCEILVPGRDAQGRLIVQPGYVRRGSDVSIGVLPFTLRNAYRQCFSLFGERYGWGGMYGGRDCSQYVLDVFRCFGIELPRNSTSQGSASTASVSLEGLDTVTRLEFIRTLPGGITLLQMPGHIMIYLGEIDGTHYAISDLWAWREPDGDSDTIAHRVARVAVTPLGLGTGTERGSYLDRLSRVAILGLYTIQE